MQHEYFMQIALELAKKGDGFVSPNPLVGAIVVKNDKIIGEGYHKAYGDKHAEVNAIDSAILNLNNLNNLQESLKGAILYVTLEPCNHFGKTPPCTQKILQSGIKKIVIAMHDPNPNVAGNGAAFLRQNGLEVVTGVLEKEAVRLNEIFIKYIKTKLPFVVVKCAATLDGQIATKQGDSKWISNEKSRQFTHKLRHSLDSILVGSQTIKIDNPLLTARLENIKTKDPIKIILDTNLSMPLNSNILNFTGNNAIDTIIFCKENISKEKRKIFEKFEQKGVKIIESKIESKNKLNNQDSDGLIDLIDLNFVIKTLGEMQISSVLIEGGSRIIYSAFKSKIVDKIFFCYAPKILGGNDGVPICKGSGANFIKDCINLKTLNVYQFDNDVIIESSVL